MLQWLHQAQPGELVELVLWLAAVVAVSFWAVSMSGRKGIDPVLAVLITFIGGRWGRSYLNRLNDTPTNLHHEHPHVCSRCGRRIKPTELAFTDDDGLGQMHHQRCPSHPRH